MGKTGSAPSRCERYPFHVESRFAGWGRPHFPHAAPGFLLLPAARVVKSVSENGLHVEIDDDKVFLELLSARDEIAVLIKNEAIAIKDKLVLPADKIVISHDDCVI